MVSVYGLVDVETCDLPRSVLLKFGISEFDSLHRLI